MYYSHCQVYSSLAQWSGNEIILPVGNVLFFLSLARKSALISKDNCMRTRSVCGFLDGLALLNQCAHFISGWTPYEAQKKTRESCPQ